MSQGETMPEVVRSAASESSSLLADTGFLESLRRQMLKFATLQLSDANLAEDAVQEALIGALRNARTFAGRAALKTWVFAILKNKIADILRQKQRTSCARNSAPSTPAACCARTRRKRISRRCSTRRASGKRISVPAPGHTPRKRCAKVNSGWSSRPAWKTCPAIRRGCS